MSSELGHPTLLTEKVTEVQKSDIACDGSSVVATVDDEKDSGNPVVANSGGSSGSGDESSGHPVEIIPGDGLKGSSNGGPVVLSDNETVNIEEEEEERELFDTLMEIANSNTADEDDDSNTCKNNSPETNEQLNINQKDGQNIEVIGDSKTIENSKETTNEASELGDTAEKSDETNMNIDVADENGLQEKESTEQGCLKHEKLNKRLSHAVDELSDLEEKLSSMIRASSTDTEPGKGETDDAQSDDVVSSTDYAKTSIGGKQTCDSNHVIAEDRKEIESAASTDSKHEENEVFPSADDAKLADDSFKDNDENVSADNAKQVDDIVKVDGEALSADVKLADDAKQVDDSVKVNDDKLSADDAKLADDGLKVNDENVSADNAKQVDDSVKVDGEALSADVKLADDAKQVDDSVNDGNLSADDAKEVNDSVNKDTRESGSQTQDVDDAGAPEKNNAGRIPDAVNDKEAHMENVKALDKDIDGQHSDKITVEDGPELKGNKQQLGSISDEKRALEEEGNGIDNNIEASCSDEKASDICDEKVSSVTTDDTNNISDDTGVITDSVEKNIIPGDAALSKGEHLTASEHSENAKVVSTGSQEVSPKNRTASEHSENAKEVSTGSQEVSSKDHTASEHSENAKEGSTGFQEVSSKNSPAVVPDIEILTTDESGISEHKSIESLDTLDDLNYSRSDVSDNEIDSDAKSDVADEDSAFEDSADGPRNKYLEVDRHRFGSDSSTISEIEFKEGHFVDGAAGTISGKDVISGYLQKLGGTGLTPRNWRKRWFVLKEDNCLYYYKISNDRTPSGVIVLLNYSVSKAPEASKRHCFKLNKGGARSYHFSASSDADMKMWMMALMKAAASVSEPGAGFQILEGNVHNVSIPALSIRDPDCHGYLSKQGHKVKSWKRRYCVLKNGYLYYYSDMANTTALGVAKLIGYTLEVDDTKGRHCSFYANAPDKTMRTYHFAAETETDRKRWMSNMENSIKRGTH